MIKSMEILQLNSMALQERLDQELEDNPLLDDDNSGEDNSNDEDHERSGDNELDTEIYHEKEMVVEDNDNNEDDFERLVEMASEWPEDNVMTAGAPSSNSMSDMRERQDDMMANAVGHAQSIQESLVEQLGFFDLPKVVRDFAEYVIYNLDDDGRLQTNLPEMVQVFPAELSLEDAESALRIVQKLDPPGIGARDLKECWLLQVPPKHPMRDVLITLISSHLEDLAHRRLPQIQ
jgi:RNA polymerase sigma-54 factor